MSKGGRGDKSQSPESKNLDNILKELNYDIINYNASDVRNKSIIETITKHNMSENNVMTMFKQNSRNARCQCQCVVGAHSCGACGQTSHAFEVI